MGQELISNMEPEIRAHEQEMAALLTEEEFKILLTILAKVAEKKA
jgi:DNA-binding MarR family transcriptional regulator